MPKMTYMDYIEDDLIDQHERYEENYAYIDAEWQALYDEIEEELNNETIK